MRILISNDDGISAPGLAALVHAVRDLGEITVVAPASPQSAMAHSITLRKPLAVEHVKLPGEPPLEGMGVDGRPADCVRLAVRNLMDARPDLVLSGINAGANVGVNVFYSGTVAAAAEAAMIGIPAVAFSLALESFDITGVDFVPAARHARSVLEQLLARPVPADQQCGAPGFRPRELVNVNIPILSAGRPLGVRVCEQSDADVQDSYVRQDSPEGIEQYRLADDFAFLRPHEESDVAVLDEGYITVTPLRTSLTDQPALGALRDWLDAKG